MLLNRHALQFQWTNKASICKKSTSVWEKICGVLTCCVCLLPVLIGLSTVDAERYSLQSVHVVVRHGDRFHLHTLPNYQHSKLRCSVDQDLIAQEPAMRTFDEFMETNAHRRKADQTFYDQPIYPRKPFCEMSDLTPEGATQHVKNGRFLRERYLQPLGLDETNYMEHIVLRITSQKSRTLQSALAFMYGFMPHYDLAQLSMEVAGNNSMCTENMPHTCHCPGVAPNIDVMACNFRQTTPEVRNQAKIRHVLEHMAATLNTTVFSMPRLSQIFDINMVHACHSALLPGPTNGQTCIDTWAVRDLYEAVQANGAKQVQTAEYQRIAALKMQPMMYEMAYRMLQQVQDDTDTQFVLYSGHDTTIEPLAAALGFSKGRWSRYASRIVLELYLAKHNKDPVIRVLSDGEVVTHRVKFCRNHIVDKALGLCPLSRLKDHVDGQYLKYFSEEPRTYAEACAVPIK